jgi:serine/threonine protein phosphatase 1
MNTLSSTAPQRLIAIGDIHGRAAKLKRLLEAVTPRREDRFVFLGDYVDRGEDSKGVIECLLSLRAESPHSVFIRGNHDQMFLDVLAELGIRTGPRLRDISAAYRSYAAASDLDIFLSNGGEATLASYDRDGQVDLPTDHLAFLEDTRLFWYCTPYIFVHAGVEPDTPLEEQDPFVMMWRRNAPPGRAGTIHVVGHTPTLNGRPRFEPGRYYLDTGAAYGRPLTACDLLTMQVWQE